MCNVQPESMLSCSLRNDEVCVCDDSRIRLSSLSFIYAIEKNLSWILFDSQTDTQ